jgi:hypothetical protein
MDGDKLNGRKNIKAMKSGLDVDSDIRDVNILSKFALVNNPFRHFRFSNLF